MKKEEFVAETMNTIKSIKEYKDKYGEDDIIEYYNTHGSYQGVEKYLSERTA